MPSLLPPSAGPAGRSLVVTLLVAGLALAGASPAAAHGIGGDAGTATTGGFVVLGIQHMLLGWDHLLFVAGILLLAENSRRAAGTISAFVAGHSLTLITATLAGWQVDPTMVDVVIVLSVAFVGGYGMLGGPKHWDVFTAVVFAFGLVHGLGLATRFQALGVPEDGMIWKLIAFNVGIELGQMTAVIAFLALAGVTASAVERLTRRSRDGFLVKASFVGLFNLAAIAAPLIAYQGFTSGEGGVGNVALPEGSGCTVADRTESFPSADGGHTEKSFYEPGEEIPLASFGHSLADGYVVVMYPDDLSEEDTSSLRAYVDDSTGVLAGARPGEAGDGLVAVTARQQMTCPDVHIGALRQFSSTWLESIGAPA